MSTPTDAIIEPAASLGSAAARDPVAPPEHGHALVPRSRGVEIREPAASYVFDDGDIATARRYATDWCRFAAWGLARNVPALPADPRAVAVSLSAEAEAGVGTASVVAIKSVVADLPRPYRQGLPRNIKDVMLHYGHD